MPGGDDYNDLQWKTTFLFICLIEDEDGMASLLNRRANKWKQESARIFADACPPFGAGCVSNHLPVANQLILFKTNVLSFVNHVISTLVYQQDAQMKDNIEGKHYIYITAVAK